MPGFAEIVSTYAAVVSTMIGVLNWKRWRRDRVGAQLTISPRFHPEKTDRLIYIELDIQATLNPTTIQAVYLAGYENRLKWFLESDPQEVVSSEWNSGNIFPKKIEPGHGWSGLLAINDRERALAARFSHVRLMVRHTGYGRIASKHVTKLLRK